MQQSFGAFIVALCASSLAAGAPTTEQPKQVGRVSVPVAARSDVQEPSGILALAKAYNKYNIPLYDDLAKAVENALSGLVQRDTGSILTKPYPENVDEEYLTATELGTPSQKLLLDFDTGSSDLWVLSADTPVDQRGDHAVYNPRNSTTAKQIDGGKWSISYGDGSTADGILYTDKVTIAGLTVEKQAIGSATHASGSFSADKNPNSGLLGLGFDKINTQKPKQKTWFTNVKDQLDAPLFTANLNDRAAGTYNFGFIDKKEYNGTIAYSPADGSRGYWGFKVDNYGVNTDKPDHNGFDAIADTGTSLILVPTRVFLWYWLHVPSSYYDFRYGAQLYRCSEKLPDFSFAVGGQTLTIPGDEINYQVASKDGKLCFGGIQRSDQITIFGDVAFKSNLVVFDVGGNRVGWAPKPKK
ncbi:hypothetical protein NLG97_g9971 [Lecanicillium saksenae]|uniref:Uncharacterized protein n=1 Tax=Lecanicillium saksenae TaxID=468837 RepID=A0ACC1QH00_9HYPO|nr:hypothetical protein NLG97_g9971 [Lecanicillium saksenae]